MSGFCAAVSLHEPCPGGPSWSLAGRLGREIYWCSQRTECADGLLGRLTTSITCLVGKPLGVPLAA